MDKERCMIWMWEESKCSICLDLFRDPVMLDCGHNFCKACITRRWTETHPRTACPQCRETIQFKMPIPNSKLASMVKEQINWYLMVMRRKKENILLLKAEHEKESEDLLKQMEEEKEKITASFRDLHQCLEERGKLLMALMLEVENEISRRRDEHLARLSVELSSLDSLTQELEEKQSASEPLEGLGNISERCLKESFKDTEAFPDSLKWKIRHFREIIPFLEYTMKQFKEFFASVNASVNA